MVVDPSEVPGVPAHRATAGPSDEFLIASLIGGDSAALSKLLDRYDRLVRFTIFRASKERCLKDPQWLDSLASATWAGFVRSVRRASGRPPRSVRAYLVQIARNQLADRRRGGTRELDTISLEREEITLPAAGEEPVELLSRMETLDSLRDCLADLDADHLALTAELPAILDRRWRDAAEALGLAESTIRSRWKVVLERLRSCVEGKTGRPLARRGRDDDS